MARLSIDPEYVAPLLDAGFRLHVVRGLLELEVYLREATGRWFLQAQIGPDGHLDLGVTQSSGWGSFIGPIHRASSASALASALPEIIRSLEALAAADHELRCPRCGAWTVVRAGRNGPVLACSRRGRLSGPRDEASHEAEPCRGTLPRTALHLHGELSSEGAQGAGPEAVAVAG